MRVPVSLEISEQCFKLAITRLQGARFKLADCVVEPVLSMTDEQIAQKISSILHQLKAHPRTLTLCLPRNLITLRNLHFPSQDNQEIIQMVNLNVARIVPYKKEELVFSYRMLGLDEMGYSKVILAIVHSNLVRRQLKILENAGLVVENVTLSSYGVWEWVLANYRSAITQVDIYVALDIDSAYTDFIIFSHANLLFTRSINIGMKTIQENPELGINKLVGEVKQLLIMFYNEEMNKKPVALFVSGAVIKEELKKIIETELAMPLKTVNSPYSPELAKANNREVPQDMSITAVADFCIRVSENRINFILPEIQIHKALKEKTKELLIMGSLLLCLFMVICANFWGMIYNQNRYLNRLNERQEEVLGEMGDLVAQLDRIEFVKAYLISRNFPMYLFYELQKATPPEIIITSVMLEEKGAVSVRGQAAKLADVFKFTSTLENIAYFKGVYTKSTRQKRAKEKEITDFEIGFNVKMDNLADETTDKRQ